MACKRSVGTTSGAIQPGHSLSKGIFWKAIHLLIAETADELIRSQRELLTRGAEDKYVNVEVIYCVAEKERCLASPLDKDGMGRVPYNTHRPGYSISNQFFVWNQIHPDMLQ